MMNAITFASTHLDKVVLGYQLVESTSIYLQNRSPQMYERLVKIRNTFNSASVVVGLVCFANFLYKIEMRWPLFYNVTFLGGLLPNGDLRIYLLFIGLIGGAYLTAATWMSTAANQLLKPKENLQLPENASDDARANTQVEWSLSPNQKFMQKSLCGRALLNISLACLSPARGILITTIVLQMISFFTTARWPMLKYKRTFTSFLQESPFPDPELPNESFLGVRDTIKTVVITYFRPMFPAMNHIKEECFCGDNENQNPRIQACYTHAAHSSCIIGSIYGGIERFSNPSLCFWINNFQAQVRTRHLNKFGEITKIVYTININRAILPSCAECRNQPGYGELTVDIEDRFLEGQFTPAEITLVEPPPPRNS